MPDIKSAWEIAQEKLEKVGEATPEERLRWKYRPEGERLGAQYVKEDINLIAEISNIKDPEARKYITQGAEEVLVRNINLPINDYTKDTNKRIMDTLKNLKKDKAAVENVYSQMRRIFQHFSTTGEEQRKQAYQQLRNDFAARLQEAMQQQGVSAGTRINVDAQPEFQAEWRKLSARMDEQYQKYLDEFKKQLMEIK